jgi:hypothetical protein
MTSNNESSKKIVVIIGVNDGIAFQTNVLTLPGRPRALVRWRTDRISSKN